MAPKPDGLEDAAIRPAEAAWSAPLGEFLLRYEESGARSPRGALLDFLESTYAAGTSLSGWDPQLLTQP